MNGNKEFAGNELNPALPKQCGLQINNGFEAFNRVYFWLHLLFCIGLGAYRITQGQVYLALLAFAAILLFLLPRLFFFLLKKEEAPQVTTLSYLYLTFVFTGGMALQAYHIVPYYDKILHTLSGTFFAFLGLICYTLVKPEKKVTRKELGAAALVSFSFSMMIAAVWEIYEYAISFIGYLDPQNVLTTGIHDTMWDIIVCLLGAVLFLIPEYLYFAKGHKGLLMAAYEAFVERRS